MFAQFDIFNVLTIAALSLIIAMLLLRSYRYFSRRKVDNAPIVRTTRPTNDDKRRYLDSPDEVARWQVAMHETARELSAELDSKMVALQVLITEADRAAARLEAAMAAHHGATEGRGKGEG